MTSFGLGVYIFQQTSRASYVALVTLSAFLPSLPLGAPTDVLADRHNRRFLMVLGDNLSATGLVFILICLVSRQAGVWQICIDVIINSVSSFLLEPAYKATITDMSTPKQYGKASGVVQIADSAKYLISLVLAGFLLAIPDIRLLLLANICTSFVVISTILVIRHSIDVASQTSVEYHSFLLELRDGWWASIKKKGLLPLVITDSLITFCLSLIQTLALPMILSFSDSVSPETITMAVAAGMLALNLLLGSISIRTSHADLLSLSLFEAGVAMALSGLWENLPLTGIFGFLFSAMSSSANTSFGYLLRTDIDNQIQGWAWELIGLISQLGYVAAHALFSVLVDYLFTLLLLPGGILSVSVRRILSTGQGRSIDLSIALAGLLLCVISAFLLSVKPIRQLGSVGNGRRL